jgi:hypothetical protein
VRRFLTQLLKLEFIYRPSRGGINEHFDLTLTEMVDRGIMRCGPLEALSEMIDRSDSTSDCGCLAVKSNVGVAPVRGER